jgi:molecular chaperone GrpE
MNDTSDENTAPRNADQGQGAAASGERAAEAGSTAGDSGELDRLRAENADLRDKLLRSMAELENFRRRAEREKSDLSKYAISDFARDMVSIGDNLRRAIEAVPRGAIDNDPSLKTLVEGVQVTERELLKVFERYGITRFDPVGEKFDPHVHEAMIKVDVPNAPADTIVQVAHAGYKIGDRVLRPAAVIVAKGGSPAPSPAGGGEAGKPEQSGAEAQQGQAPQGGAKAGEAGRSQGEGGEPVGAHRNAGPRRGPQPDKRSNMTKPVTESNGPQRKEEFISTFGKRLEN